MKNRLEFFFAFEKQVDSCMNEENQMIKNIVFDMGNVLVRYDPMRACRQFSEDEKEQQMVNTSVFVSPEWLFLDMGLISEEEALKKMKARLPEGHAREAARMCLEHWHEYCMWEIPGIRELIKELKEKGYGIYLCSNASLRMLSCYRQVLPGIEWFDGVLFSAEVKCIKPQKEMYQHLYRRFHLIPQECFFVDDLPANIKGAAETGMDGYCFADGDVEKLRQNLRDNLFTTKVRINKEEQNEQSKRFF